MLLKSPTDFHHQYSSIFRNRILTFCLLRVSTPNLVTLHWTPLSLSWSPSGAVLNFQVSCLLPPQGRLFMPLLPVSSGGPGLSLELSTCCFRPASSWLLGMSLSPPSASLFVNCLTPWQHLFLFQEYYSFLTSASLCNAHLNVVVLS